MEASYPSVKLRKSSSARSGGGFATRLARAFAGVEGEPQILDSKLFSLASIFDEPKFG